MDSSGGREWTLFGEFHLEVGSADGQWWWVVLYREEVGMVYAASDPKNPPASIVAAKKESAAWVCARDLDWMRVVVPHG